MIDLTRTRRADRALRALWSVNLATLIGLIAWAYFDPRFTGVVNVLQWDVRLFLSNGQLLLRNPDRFSAVVILSMLAVAAISGLAVFVALFLGPAAHRRLRSWLALLTLVAAWLTVWLNWPEVAWLGQQRRLRAELTAFEALAASLREDWPTQDGEHPLLGPYMAYPIGRPSVLLLPTAPKPPHGNIQVAAIEHHPGGGLCFQVSAAETGAWLEWHPPGQSPQSFTGGVGTDYRLERAIQIAPGWFLVRYDEPSTHELELLRPHRRPAPN